MNKKGRDYTVQPGDNLSLIVAKNPDLGYSNWLELLEANKTEIMRVGREQMAAMGINADVNKGPPCGIAGHTAPRHYIANGVHYDELDVPTIYPGTTFFLKSKVEQNNVEPLKETQKSGEVIEKQWMGTEHQFPIPKLEIFTRGDPNTPDITFPDTKGGRWSKLLGYTFTEAVDDLDGSFSFTVEDDQKEKFGTVFDLLPIRSIVKIYEGDTEKPAFVGVVRQQHFRLTMTSQGVRRIITFIGKSIISYIAEYTISLDIRIHNVQDPESKRMDLTAKLARDNLTIKNFMKITWEHFKEVSEHAGISTAGIADIIKKFIGDGPDNFVKVTGKGQSLRYNVACVFYNAANNVIADVWRNILPERVYEFFSRCENGEPRIITRQVPFEPEDWSALDAYVISPISLTAYELDRSDQEVYTAFASYIIGSARAREFYMAVGQIGNDDIVAHDKERQKLYGFKPLEINFNGYDRQGNRNGEKEDDIIATLRELNKMTKYWYSRLDEMYSGNLTVITDFKEPRNNPRVGCRAIFIGGEFYINRVDHSWVFGGTPTLKLAVSRGMMYDNTGKMKAGADGVIKNVGGRFRELEKEKG